MRIIRLLWPTAAIALTVTAVAMEYAPQTMAQRLDGAELVVVGEVVEISTRAYSWSTHKLHQNYTSYYDVATLKVSRVIKGEIHKQPKIGFLFDSPNQLENPWRIYHTHYNIGDSGIWFFFRDWHTGHYYPLGYPPNPEPAEKLDEILKVQKLKG